MSRELHDKLKLIDRALDQAVTELGPHRDVLTYLSRAEDLLIEWKLKEDKHPSLFT